MHHCFLQREIQMYRLCRIYTHGSWVTFIVHTSSPEIVVFRREILDPVLALFVRQNNDSDFGLSVLGSDERSLERRAVQTLDCAQD